MSGVFRESVWPWSKCQLQSTAQATSAQFTPTAYLATTKQLADMDVMNTADANPQNVQDLTVFVSITFCIVIINQQNTSLSIIAPLYPANLLKFEVQNAALVKTAPVNSTEH